MFQALAQTQIATSSVPWFEHFVAWPVGFLKTQLATFQKVGFNAEVAVACVVMTAFMLPFVAFATPNAMNGINRAARQLSQRTMRGSPKPVRLAEIRRTGGFGVATPELLHPARVKIQFLFA